MPDLPRPGAGALIPVTTSLTHRLSGAAAVEFDRLVPRPVRGVIDRTLVDVACASRRGIVAVAGELRVDVPAVDAWRHTGVPAPFRARLATMAVRPVPTRCRAGGAA